MDSKIVEGSDNAKNLEKVWKLRQEELKLAMSEMIKPAEVMANIARVLRDSNLKYDNISTALIELEVMLSDVDNARDFHTIGGWPVLISYLLSDKSTFHRELAAWAVGTAIKNSYDYQLWTLELLELNTTNKYRDHMNNNDSNVELIYPTLTTTCIDLLISIMHIESDAELILSQTSVNLIQRTLYAISAATRGNIEVQEYLFSNYQFLQSLKSFALKSKSIKIFRKVWNFICDVLIDKRYFLQNFSQLLEESVSSFAENANVNVIDDDSLKGQLKFSLLGDKFCTSEWLMVASQNVDILSELMEDQSLNLSRIEKNEIKSTIEHILQAVTEIISACRSEDEMYVNSIKSIHDQSNMLLPYFDSHVDSLIEVDGSSENFLDNVDIADESEPTFDDSWNQLNSYLQQIQLYLYGVNLK